MFIRHSNCSSTGHKEILCMQTGFRALLQHSLYHHHCAILWLEEFNMSQLQFRFSILYNECCSKHFCFLTVTLNLFPKHKYVTIMFTLKYLQGIFTCFQGKYLHGFFFEWKKDRANHYLRSMTSECPAVWTGMYADTSGKFVDISGPMNIKVLFRRMCRRKYFSQTAMTHCYHMNSHSCRWGVFFFWQKKRKKRKLWVFAHTKTPFICSKNKQLLWTKHHSSPAVVYQISGFSCFPCCQWISFSDWKYFQSALFSFHLPYMANNKHL